MPLRRSLIKDLDGEIKMDMSHALIPVGDKRVKINLEPKAKYIVLKSDDPRAEIFYVDTRHGTYMMTSTKEDVIELLVPDITNESWLVEFDGSSSSSSSGARIVFMSPKGEKFPKTYNLVFETTNNTIEYEALLLVLECIKEKEIK